MRASVIGALTALALSAQSASAFDFTPGVAASTPFRTSNNVQQSVFNCTCITAQYNNDTGTNPMWYVASNIGGRTSNVLESLLPAGDLGQQVGVGGYGFQNKIILRLQDADVINISFDLYLAPGYYLGSLAKQVPHLGFGDDTKTTASSLNFGYEASPQPPLPPPGGSNPVFMFYYAAYSGTAVASSYSGPIGSGQWYSFKMQLARGPNGYAKIWMNGVPVFNAPATNIATTEPPFVQFSSWFGGGSSIYSPPNNALSYLDNIHIWSGTVDSATPTTTPGATPTTTKAGRRGGAKQ